MSYGEQECGYELDNDGHGHSRCPVPVIDDALGDLGVILGRKK